MGLFSTITGIFGGNSAKKASRKAESAQIQALERAMGVVNDQYNTTRQDYAPFREGGLQGLERLLTLMGFNGTDDQNTGLLALRESPMFQRRYQAGEDAVLANASATGGLRGGNVNRSLYNLGEDTFAATLNDELTRLYGLTGIGTGATDNLAALGQNRASTVADLFGKQGDARAQGLLTRGGINSRMWGNVGGVLDDAASSIFGGFF